MRKKFLLILLAVIFIATMSYAGTITVTNPTSGITWYKGTTKTITWTSSGIPSGTNMIINIFKNSISQANFVLQLTSTNTGSKNWPIPASLSIGRYVIRIKTDDSSVHGDSAGFNIANAPSTGGSIGVTNPTHRAVWCKGRSYYINWTSSGIPSGANMIINIFKNSISQANFVLQLTSTNTHSRRWVIPSNFNNGRYVIRIKTDDSLIHGDSSTFTITDDCDPEIHIDPWIIEKLKHAKLIKIVGWGPHGPIGPDPDPPCPVCLKINIAPIREYMRPPVNKFKRFRRDSSPKILMVLYEGNEPIKEMGVIETNGKPKFNGEFSRGNKDLLIVNVGKAIKRGNRNLRIVFKNMKTGEIINSAPVNVKGREEIRK
jgi:hypothetical protein